MIANEDVIHGPPLAGADCVHRADSGPPRNRAANGAILTLQWRRS
jgi:hypothetical protein